MEQKKNQAKCRI